MLVSHYPHSFTLLLAPVVEEEQVEETVEEQLEQQEPIVEQSSSSSSDDEADIEVNAVAAVEIPVDAPTEGMFYVI